MRRFVDSLLAELLSYFPCVALIGPRQCGKTTALTTLPRGFQRFDLERASDHGLISGDPESFLRHHPGPLAFDEAQLAPSLFPALRVAIDELRSETGRYVVTGSSSPELQRNLSETLAGRVAIIEMSPCTLAEVGGGENQRLLQLLLEGDPGDESPVPPERRHLASEYWFEGGYPELWVKPAARFRKLWKDNFVRTYLERDLRPLFPGIEPVRFRNFLGVLASVSGTVLNLSDLARALAVSQPTVRQYLDIAHGTFLWRRFPAYTRNVAKRLVKHPYGHVRDSGLLHHLMHVPNLAALRTHVLAGRSWQALVTEEILRTLEGRGIGFEACYYRTAAGAEVDLVLEGDFGLVPIEIKLSSHLTARELRPIKDFMEQHRCSRGIVVYGGERVAQLGESLFALPFLLF